MAEAHHDDTKTSTPGYSFNSIAGAVLASLLVLVGIRTGIELFYPEGTANLSKGKIVVAPEAAKAPEATAAAKPEEKEPPVETLLASADAAAGEKSAKACAACHNWAKGAGTKIGPDLYGVVGRDIGKEPGFSYSEALQKKGGKWTFDTLYEWIKDPKAFAPGNKMAFAGVKDSKERANIIAFLDKQGDKPVPLSQK
jgi:cytochrome c